MADIFIASGAAVQLQLILRSADTGKFPQVQLRTRTSAILLPLINLTHTSVGVYSATGPILSDGAYTAIYKVYEDAGRTAESAVYSPTEDTLQVGPILGGSGGGGGSLTAADVWNYLASSATTAGSLGRRIADLLDAAVSTRADASTVSSQFALAAKEATLNTAQNQITSEINQNESLINALTVIALAIQSKTQNIPVDPARQTLIDTSLASIQAALASIGLSSTLIKNKTDLLPADPARESSVQARPTNPVLVTDPRLNFLDAPVSGMTGGGGVDISQLATKQDLNIAADGLSDSIEVVRELAAVTLQIEQNTQGAIGRIPLFPAQSGEVFAARDSILTRIDLIPNPAQPSDVWAYPVRALTTPFPTVDISNLATKQDVQDSAKTIYTCRASTVLNNLNGEQEIICWAEKDNQLVVGGIATVVVKDSLGQERWTATAVSPNIDGIYRFSHGLTVTQSQNFYMIVSIVIDNGIKTTLDSFYTIV
jgi:hypothetical protein